MIIQIRLILTLLQETVINLFIDSCVIFAWNQ
jgi:hypothetical protein